MSKKVTFQRPVMSWDKPIEQEILGFVRYMKNHMELLPDGRDYASAYETVEKHILKEIRLRKKIKEAQND